MTATINASTTAGVVTTADTSGILQLQTNGTAALTVNASQNVGIGTSSPTAKLDVRGQTVIDNVTASTSKNLSTWNVNGANFAQLYDIGTVANVIALGGSPVIATVPSTPIMAWDLDNANVGIGTSSPTQKLTVNGVVASIGQASSLTASSFFIDYNTTSNLGRLAAVGNTTGTAAPIYFSQYSSNASVGRDAMIIDSSGNLLVNTTTAIGTITTRNTGGYTMGSVRTGTGGEGHISFRNANGEVGYIQTSGSATQYITSSDYRLKEAIAPMTGALDKVALLKPRTYKWNIDGSDGQGFIAHELAEVVPDCVTGEKDAVQEEQYEVTPAVKDEEGNIVTEAVMGTRTVPAYQGIDTSFLVATLTAAIQEQQALITQLQADVSALKGQS